MGVIYKSLEVRDSKLPKAGDHLAAANLVCDRISDIGDVAMTLVHGSVPERRFGIRSDLDVVVNFSTESVTDRPAKSDEIKSVLDDISDATHVKIEPNIWPANDPLSAIEERMYDLLFSWHLAKSMTNPLWCRGEIDARVVSIAERTHGVAEVRRVAMNYVVHKADGFTKAPRLFNEDDSRCIAAMQRGLELPKSAGRKVTQLYASVEGRVADSNEISSISSVSDHLSEATVAAIAELRRIDRDYSDLLAATQQGYENARIEYLAWLDAHYTTVLHAGMIATAGFITFVDKFGSDD